MGVVVVPRGVGVAYSPGVRVEVAAAANFEAGLS